MEHHPLGRIDAQPLEQFGIAQRQFDHLAQLVDRFRHAADIVIGDVGAAGFARLLIFRAQLHLGLGVDMDDALGHGRHHDQADFLERIGRRRQHLAQMGRHVAGRHLLLAGGGDDIARDEGALKENALQRIRITLETEIILCRREHDALGRTRIDLAQLNEVARADAGIGALQTIQAQDVQTFIFLVGAHHPRRSRSLADNLDNIAFGQLQFGHYRQRKPRQTAPGILRPRIGDLNPASAAVLIGHGHPRPFGCETKIGNAGGEGKGPCFVMPGTKKGPAQAPARKVYRRGCLKGLSYVRCSR